jgi:hypothetical protein
MQRISWQEQLKREGKPPWYKAMRKETAENRRVTRRKYRHACKNAVDLGEEPPRMRGTCGWLSW